jgi:monoterpene epsilon-lactone hydrolase
VAVLRAYTVDGYPIIFGDDSRMPSIQSRLLNGFFRCFVRPRVNEQAKISDIRRFVERMDGRLARPWPGQLHRSTELGGVPCDYFELPGNRPDRVLLYLHGGGFVIHIPKVYAGFLGRLAGAIHANIWMPDYRLAPEHPFPAGPDDCLAAYRGLLDKGIAPENIVVMGDSAGGCLTLATLQQARLQGLPMPAAAVTLSAVSETGTPSSTAIANSRKDAMFNISSMMLFRRHYIQNANPLDAKASPYYGSFEGFPPLLMFASSSEMLLADTVSTARRAAFQGVQVQAQIWQSMIHVWPVFHQLPESGQALQTISGFINQALADPSNIRLPAEIRQGIVPVNTFPPA